MRAFERDQIALILSTAAEGVAYAKTAPEEAALPVIKDCLEAAGMVAEFLEGVLSPPRAAFYGGLLSGVRALLENFSEAAAGEILIKLKEISKELEGESEVKIKAAFFPYKASMWDALESVWLAAENDPRCETAVVPLRYADRAPDGAVLKIHCERELFPDYVPVLRVEDYNLEEERPDIAYIHNPYDGNNFVTSVEPGFYSHELKKHVGTLVYIPYYVSNANTDENMAKITCASAADIIAVRSEEETEVFREFDPGRDLPALGSPKVDRILRYEKKKPEMPPEWRERLSGKRVFLLNTSVSTLLREDTKFNEKLHYLFSIFESREDAALLWRPHPLSEATMGSMRPELLEGYEELERRIKAGGFGVLDETADVTRAIALSDAYIGESATSLVFMFAITGKPVYVLDFDIGGEITQSEREEVLRSVSLGELMLEEGGETALAMELETNRICRIDTQTGRLCPAAELPGVSEFDYLPYSQIVDCGDKYILPPAYSDCFIELDKKLNFIRKVELPERAKARAVFGYPIKRGKYVYFMPAWSAAIARYNTETGGYEYFYDWYEKVGHYATQEDEGIFGGFFRAVDNKVYLPCYKDNIAGVLNLDTMEIKLRKIGNAGNRYQSMDYDGKYFWLTRFRPPRLKGAQWSDSIVRWDPKTGKSESFNRFPKDFEPGYMSFRRIVFCGSYLLAFPQNANMIVKIDPKSGKMTRFGAGLMEDPKNPETFLPDPKAVAFGHAECVDGRNVMAAMLRERALLTIDVKTGETQKIPLRFDEPYRETERRDIRKFQPPGFDKNNKGIFYERLLFPPRGFTEAVSCGLIPPANKEQAEFYLEKVSNPDGSCGEKLHEYVMKRALGGNGDEV